LQYFFTLIGIGIGNTFLAWYWQWLNSAGTGRNGVPPPLSGVPPPEIAVPPPEIAVPPPKVVVPPPGNDVPSSFGGKSLNCCHHQRSDI